MLQKGWTREELLKALELYCLTPFGRIHSRNPQIQNLAAEIGRTASAVALKMVNFASLDPTLKQRGMANASRLDREVWDQFFAHLSASLVADSPMQPTNEIAEPQRDFITEITAFPEGTDVLRSIKTRVNQSFFRRLVLTSYDNKCALTGIEAPELLIASHIVPWSKNKDARTTPQNGICLNALHDRAFDEGYLTFTDDFEVLYSWDLPSVARTVLESFGARKLRLPSRFVPDPALLAFHRTKIFHHQQ
jgi:putative restriction endonuclease